MAKVLIVDDELIVREFLARILSREGFEVATAGDARAAMDFFNQFHYDIAIVDINLRNTSGLNLVKDIKESSPDTQIIMITGDPTVHTATEALRLGVFDYLSKPIVPGDILMVVLRAEQMKKLQDDKRELQKENENYKKHLEELIDKPTSRLREREKKYRLIADNVTDVVWSIDLAGNFTVVTPSVEHVLGYTGDEMLEMNVRDVLTPESYENSNKVIAAMIAKGEHRRFEEFDPVTLQVEQVYKDGQLGWGEAKIILLRHDETLEITGLIGVSRDITERKKSEDELGAIRRNLQVRLNELTCLYNINRVLYESPEPPTTIFWEVVKLLPISWQYPKLACARLIINDKTYQTDNYCDSLHKQKAEIIANGEICGQVEVIYIEDVPEAEEGPFLKEERILIEAVAKQIGHFVEYHHSENERKSLESQLLQAQKMESIGQLAAGIAHEINTPTQYVGDNTRFLRDAFEDIISLLSSYECLIEKAKGIDSLDAEIQNVEAMIRDVDLEFVAEEIPKAIEQSLDGIERISEIVQAMKKFSHPSAEEKTASDINEGLVNTITVARNEWKYVADVKTDLDPKLPLIDCHLSELNQVFLNIIVNAAQAIGEGGDGKDGVKGTISVSSRQDGDFVDVRISDTGPGMSENVKRRIFDPFFTTKDVGKGTGQGLAIAHSAIAKKHGGTITCDSKEGVGTTFIIRLPIYSPESTE